jgi:hypothetical protein
LTALSGIATDLKVTGTGTAAGPFALDRHRAIFAAPSRAERARCALLGIILAILALSICAALGLLIVSGPFHTSIGALA